MKIDNKRIYNTSDDVITDGDWVLLVYPKGKELKKMVMGVPFGNAKCINSEIKYNECKHKKIESTTDPRLFKDGVTELETIRHTKADLKKYVEFLKLEGIVIEEENKPQDFEFLYGVWIGENPNGLL
jgi:hypothetical protein